MQFKNIEIGAQENESDGYWKNHFISNAHQLSSTQIYIQTSKASRVGQAVHQSKLQKWKQPWFWHMSKHLCSDAKIIFKKWKRTIRLEGKNYLQSFFFVAKSKKRC